MQNVFGTLCRGIVRPFQSDTPGSRAIINTTVTRYTIHIGVLFRSVPLPAHPLTTRPHTGYALFHLQRTVRTPHPKNRSASRHVPCNVCAGRTTIAAPCGADFARQYGTRKKRCRLDGKQYEPDRRELAVGRTYVYGGDTSSATHNIGGGGQYEGGGTVYCCFWREGVCVCARRERKG